MIKLNGEKINVTNFPDRTSQVWKLNNKMNDAVYHVEWLFENESEFMQLAQLRQLLSCGSYKYVSLSIPFLPYGRQDKDVSNDKTFALHTFAGLINYLRFDQIITYDAHNPELTSNLFNNLVNIVPLAIQHINVDNPVYILPDKGASRYLNFIPNTFEVIVCDKNRNQDTGHIDSYRVNGNVCDRNVIVIDDICDGGKTFEILGQNLKEQKVKSAHLLVTHGIFSKGVLELRKYYDTISCVNLLNKNVSDVLFVNSL